VALGYRDIYTHLHSQRVRDLSCTLGKACGLSEDELGGVRVAASFHDIGKLGIPDSILAKPGHLDDAEMIAMQRHSAIGQDILKSVELPSASEAATIIRHHHEQYDGSGYPDGLSGEAIPLASRIISIADSYSAMAERRAYHPARTHREVIAILQEERGTKHDPHVLDAFLHMIEQSPLKVEEK